MPFLLFKTKNKNLNSNNNTSMHANSNNLLFFEKSKKISSRCLSRLSTISIFSNKNVPRNSLYLNKKKIQLKSNKNKMSAQSSFFGKFFNELSKKSSKNSEKLEKSDQIKDLIEILLKNPLILENLNQILNSPNIELINNLFSKVSNDKNMVYPSFASKNSNDFKNEIQLIIKNALNDFFKPRLNHDSNHDLTETNESGEKKLNTLQVFPTKISEKIKKFDNLIKENQSKPVQQSKQIHFKKLDNSVELLGFKNNLSNLIENQNKKIDSTTNETKGLNNLPPKLAHHLLNPNVKNANAGLSASTNNTETQERFKQISESDLSLNSNKKSSKLSNTKDSLMLIKHDHDTIDKLDADCLSTNSTMSSLFFNQTIHEYLDAPSNILSENIGQSSSLSDLNSKKVNFHIDYDENVELLKQSNFCDSDVLNKFLSYLVKQMVNIRNENMIPRQIGLMTNEQLLLEESCLESILDKIDNMCDSTEILRKNNHYLELKERLKNIKVILGSL